MPCNQFGGQEPGSAEEIAEFCSATYGVTFPMTEKVDVNGDERHPLFRELADRPRRAGPHRRRRVELREVPRRADGTVLCRFHCGVEPGDERLVAAVERALGASAPA